MSCIHVEASQSAQVGLIHTHRAHRHVCKTKSHLHYRNKIMPMLTCASAQWVSQLVKFGVISWAVHAGKVTHVTNDSGVPTGVTVRYNINHAVGGTSSNPGSQSMLVGLNCGVAACSCVRVS
jgi:hypothetical protein